MVTVVLASATVVVTATTVVLVVVASAMSSGSLDSLLNDDETYAMVREFDHEAWLTTGTESVLAKSKPIDNTNAVRTLAGELEFLKMVSRLDIMRRTVTCTTAGLSAPSCLFGPRYLLCFRAAIDSLSGIPPCRHFRHSLNPITSN